MLSKEARLLLLKKDKEKKKTKVTHYMIAFVYSSRKWKLVYSERKQSGCLGARDRQEGEITKKFEETCEVMDMSVILIVVMVSQI